MTHLAARGSSTDQALSSRIGFGKLYHGVPDALSGDTLHPLTRLKDIYPEVYERECSKYVGREELMQRIIPGLNCLWNDVLQFSPVHPALVKDAMVAEQLPWRRSKWFEVDPISLGFNENNASIFWHSVRAKGDFSFSPSDFEPFKSERLPDLSELPEATKSYYREVSLNRERPFVFLFIPHILYRGSIEVSKLKVIEV